MTVAPTVSIIIVNYNSGRYLKSCLENLLCQTERDYEVVVVDNASSDDSLQGVERFAPLQIIRNRSNRGFAAGQNQGISATSGRYILSLNYDLIMQQDFIEQLVDGLERVPAAGWATGKLLNMTPEGKRLDTLYAAGHVFARDRFSFLRGNAAIDIGQYDQPEVVFGAPGAAALYKREMVADVNLNGQFFDECLFTWYEDVDVDWRATRAGWQCVYVPSAVAYHVGHIGEHYQEPYRSWRAAYGIRNRWLVIAANESMSCLRRDCSSLIRYEFSCLLYVVRAGLMKAYLRAVWGMLANVPYVLSKRRMGSDTTGPRSNA